MEIARIEKKNLVHEVHRQMREMITSGSWPEGSRIASEHRLGADFNVSRVVVREALQRLRAERLVVTRQGSGSYVANPNNFRPGNEVIALSEAEFTDVMELRQCLEFRAVELAAKAAVQADFDAMSAALTAMESAVGDAGLFSDADYAFHHAVICSAHNRMFIRAMDSCEQYVRYCLREMNKLADSHGWGIELHREQLEKMTLRDARGAIRALKRNRDYNHARLADYFVDRRKG